MKNRIPMLATALAVLVSSNSRADYPSLVLSDNPKGYYRLNDSTARTLINNNIGSLGAAGNATNDLASFGGVVHSIPGAIVGDGNKAAFYDFTTRTEIPFNSALNTPNTQPFTVEAWIYPVSDQVGTGMGALANRWTQGGNREGWVMYQRAPDANHCTTCGPGIGWEFRMYNNLDGSGHLDVTSGVPFSLGKWQHVVVVYEPIGGDPTNSTLTIYIDGVPANTNINTSPIPGYAPCTGAHSPAPNGQPALALAGYNNSNSGGNYGDANPWIGGIDEFAWYPAKLTPAQILAHYQNGTNANRAQSYSSLILSQNPAAYLRLDEQAPGADYASNIGDLRSAGLGVSTAGVRHSSGGALAGDSGAGSTSYHYRNGGGTTTQIPFTAQNNPDASFPFSLECWVRPTGDQMNPGPAVMNNRFVNPNPGSNASGSPVKNRTGWVIYQRCPDITYTTSGPVGESGFGYALRVYAGTSGNSSDVQTITPYTMGQWSHMVFTWEPQLNVSPAGNNGVAWNGILTAYVNGVPVNTNTSATYCANTSPSDDGSTPADFGIGSYNAASGFGEEFEGDIAEVAFYNNYVLTSDQILAHYQAGTNSNYGTNYATLVMTAPSEPVSPPIAERLYLPATYMRLNDSAWFPAVNSGSAGAAGNGNLVLTTNIAAGPQSPTYPGFEASNSGLPLDGVKEWASLNNAAGMNISGQITLEAWVKPGASQGATARILTHGPNIFSKFDDATLGLVISGSMLNSNEVFLRIDGSGANYIVGSSDGANTNAATYAVPAGDLGSTTWIHLVGTYDGANWKLYRNGVLVATQASGVGALPNNYTGWAIGSSGNGWSDPFSGQVDEVAVYDHALTANQVLGHYNAGTLTPKLNITHSGANVTVTWPYGTLYHATNVTGPWTAVPGNPAFSFTTNTVAPRRFFRF